MKRRGLFVTGTDTGVGKTVVTALLASALSRRGVDAGVMKPVATGCEETREGLSSPDTLFLLERAGTGDPASLVTPVRFRKAAAPAIAARSEGTEVDIAPCDRAFATLARAHELLLVEGIGGLLVPLSRAFTVADLVRRWRLPLLVVARPGLGTINHTLLTLAHARTKGIETAGFLFNASRPLESGAAWRSSAAWIEEAGGAPFLGLIPYGGAVDSDRSAWEALCAEADGLVGGNLRVFGLA